MNSRPKHALLVLIVLLAGCGSPAPGTEPDQPAATEITITPPPAEAATTETTDATQATEAATTAATTATPKPRPTTKPVPKATSKKPTPKPTTKKPTPKPTGGNGQQGVHPGAFCKPEGATGHTAKGTRMRCTRKAGEDQPRWRAA
jgi:hypothetical protein